MSDLLDHVLEGAPAAFALLHRPGAAPGTLEVLVGETSVAETLARIPLPAGGPPGPAHEALVLVPYRQIAERGFECVDDGEPLLTLSVTDQEVVPLATALPRLPDLPTELSNEHFDLDDETFARMVETLVRDEIGTGQGANFVAKRTYVADIADWDVSRALSFFRRLLAVEPGAYWTFLVHTGERTLVGASPERHVSLDAGIARMTPISGTYRYGPGGPTLTGVLDFLDDRKECDELYMVVDEELKMMARICPDGGRVAGPYLREMARLAHTEYVIEGRTTADPREVLRETLFAPTVTGSPLESACRVINRHEPGGRAYYSGVLALIGRDDTGERTLDSAILIRTADIDAGGRVSIGVGATVVRHSDPASEAAETQAKADGLLAALYGGQSGFAAHPSVRDALARRNDGVSGFWMGSASSAEPSGPRVLVVDAEDAFTAMLAVQLRSLGLRVEVRRYDDPMPVGRHDLVVSGPGPGDPQDVSDPRVARLHALVRGHLADRTPLLAVCLSHQVLSSVLALDIVPRHTPAQGIQREIDLFGRREVVGFYNTYCARADRDRLELPGVGPVSVSRDRATGEVHALRGPHFASVQFHPESVLTQDGPRIIGSLVEGLLAARATPEPLNRPA